MADNNPLQIRRVLPGVMPTAENAAIAPTVSATHKCEAVVNYNAKTLRVWYADKQDPRYNYFVGNEKTDLLARFTSFSDAIAAMNYMRNFSRTCSALNGTIHWFE